MSHLAPSCLLNITDALTSPPCMKFFLLLRGTWEVTACSSNAADIGFISAAGRTILPLAQPHALPSLRTGWAWYNLFPHAHLPALPLSLARTEWRQDHTVVESPWLNMSLASYTHSKQTKPNGRYFLFLQENNQLLCFTLSLSFLWGKINFTAGFSSD